MQKRSTCRNLKTIVSTTEEFLKSCSILFKPTNGQFFDKPLTVILKVKGMRIFFFFSKNTYILYTYINLTRYHIPGDIIFHTD